MPYDIDYTNNSIEELLVQTSSNVPELFGLVLLLEFIVIMFAVSQANKKSTGYTNIAMSGAIAGLVTTTSGFFLYLVEGLIPLYYVITCLVVTIAFALFFMFSDDEN